MDVRQLRQFVHLAEALHFGRASAAANVSPSALSRSIRQFEAEVGAVLFDRDNRSVTLTRQGVAFLAWTRDVLAGVAVRRQGWAVAASVALVAFGAALSIATRIEPAFDIGLISALEYCDVFALLTKYLRHICQVKFALRVLIFDL